MSGDPELDRLMAKRMDEMRRSAQRPEPGPEKPDARGALIAALGHRGREVLDNAERQYPEAARAVAEQLGRLLMSGAASGPVDGGELLAVFRSVGLNVRVSTTIRVEKDGKMVPLADKMSGESDEI